MTLTRRRLNTERFESWGIFKGDLQIGTISSGTGTNGAPIWRWSCGFYPGCTPGQCSEGIQITYAKAKTELKKAWERLEPQITPAMADEWLESEAATAWKYAMWEAGCKMPAQIPTGVSRCFCGAEITAETAPAHVYEKHMTTKNLIGLEPSPGIAWKNTMLGKPHRTFVPESKYPTPESAARELLRLYREHTADGYPYAYAGVTNAQFTRDGGTLAEYRAGIDYGIAQGWFSIDGGGRVTVLKQD